MQANKNTNWSDPYIDAGIGFMPINKRGQKKSFDLSGQQTDFDDKRRLENDEERRSRSRRSPRPLNSNTGGKLTDAESGYEICLDWLRLSGPRKMRNQAVELLTAYYGSATYGKGRFFLSNGYRFGNAGVFFDPDEEVARDHAVVDIPGEAMGEITMHQAIEIIDGLFKLGFKMCRMDIAIDLYSHTDLIETMTKSCMNGELCRAKKFEPKYVQSGKHLTGHGCNVGVRGKDGSGRYLRVYDKTLQTKTGDAGGWVRWEAELSDECAQEAAMQIVLEENFIQIALSHAFGVCDFREVTGSEHLHRRPRSKWFEDLIGRVQPTRVVQSRSKSTLHSFKRWMQTSVVPKLETLSAATGHSMDTLIDTLFGEFEPDAEHLEDSKVRALCIEAGGDPSEAMHRLGNRRLVMVSAGAG